uniref:CHAT domain-containing protein n=1 Tax=Calothrix rhizosoleniae TaxID=888997 RepID=UPI0011788002
EIKPDYHEAWYNRGLALGNLGKYEQAIVSWDKALEIKPDYHKAWYNRGLDLGNLGRYEQAIASWDKALEIKPDYHEAWCNRGLDLGNLGRYEQAIASFDKAVAIKPDLHLAWYNRGNALGNLGKYEPAIASYDKALAIKPDLHLAWIGRGIAAGNSFSSPLWFSFSSNPDLNQRRYKGKLASYEEGLKYCPQETHLEGGGLLHQAIGNAHYYQGLSASHPRSYRNKAAKSYNQALKTLTAADYPEAHLEVLQDLIHVHLDLRETAKAEELQRQGTDVLRRLLDECKSPGKKRQLGLKFVSFQQLTVDVAVQSGNWCAALELAEKGKNTCLSWLLDDRDDVSPTWKEIQQLLNPTTAIVYWHLSPAALHTFILQHNSPSPIVLGETRFPSHIYKFENWLNKWNEQYANYRKGKDKPVEEEKNWRKNLPNLLDELAHILNISTIIQSIQSIQNPKSKIVRLSAHDEVQNLILVPHRDLHRLPLHALFPDNFTITYLPSAQIGLSLAELSRQQQNTGSPTKLLSVEHPKSTDSDDKPFDKLPYAEMESATITRMFSNPQRLADNDVTKKNLQSALQSGHDIFHFTGHGTYNFHNPKESALALSGKHRLTLEDILQLEDIPLRNYKMVSLSACETGVTGKQTITTEYVGLVSGFLRQGVSHVVSTLWTAESVSSALFMIEFYRQPDWDIAPAIALKRTQMWLRNVTYRELMKWYSDRAEELAEYNDIDAEELSDEADKIRNNPGKMDSQIPPYAHPYYWANFTITGNINS